MKNTQPLPYVIRLWLFLSAAFAWPIQWAAKRSHVKSGADPIRFAERLGQPSVSASGKQWIWVHAASLGEIGQARAVITQLIQDHGQNVVVTTMSQSGADWVAKEIPAAVNQFMPLDTPRAVAQFLDAWQPIRAVFIEGDLWPRLVIGAAQRHIPLTLLNARPSKSRERMPKTNLALLACFAAITCKSQQVADSLARLGIPQERVHNFGDLRASAPALSVDTPALGELNKAIAGRPIWVAASSHAEDEAAIIDACRLVLKQQPNTLLIWAPRHPQRATAIIAAANGLSIQQRSLNAQITKDTQIYLADTLGELGTLFSSSDIVFLGGSFGDEGGHNPYEPACFGCVVVSGENFRNHKDGFAALAGVDAAIIVKDGTELGQEINALLSSGDAVQKGKAGRALVAKVNGAADKSVALILS